jgi:hypothetical protein
MTRCKHCGSTSFCKWQSPPDVIDALPPCCLDAEDMVRIDDHWALWFFVKLFAAVGVVIVLIYLGLAWVH